MQQFYRPNGDSTQNRGVIADVVLPSLTTHISKGESELDYALAFDKVDPATFDKNAQVTDEILTKLREKSTERVSKSEDFKGLLERVARYDEDAARKTMPLNEDKFMELRKRADAEKTEREQFDTLEPETEKHIERDFYLNEVMDIAADYVTALGS